MLAMFSVIKNLGVEFAYVPITKATPATPSKDIGRTVLVFRRWERNYRLHQVSYNFGGYNPLRILEAMTSDINVALGAEKFEDWEHDFPTKKEARAAYRKARQMAKDAIKVFGDDGWKRFCAAVMSDIRVSDKSYSGAV